MPGPCRINFRRLQSPPPWLLAMSLARGPEGLTPRHPRCPGDCENRRPQSWLPVGLTAKIGDEPHVDGQRPGARTAGRERRSVSTPRCSETTTTCSSSLVSL